MTLVQDGLLDLPTLLARLSSGPAAALRLPAGELKAGGAADLVLFDPQASTVAGEQWLSRVRTARSSATACRVQCVIPGRWARLP